MKFNPHVLRTVMFFFILMSFVLSCRNEEAVTDKSVYENYKWQERIIKDHPRLFFNSSTFKNVKARALNEEKEMFSEMKTRADALIGKKIEFTDPYIKDGTENRDHEYGFRAAESALLYLILEDKKYLDLTKDLLRALTDYYTLRNKANLNIQWYAFSRIGTLCAYDWIYNDLSEKERAEIGGPLLKAIDYMIYEGQREKFFRENDGDYTTGFYGPPSLPWYTGVVFYKTGINDTLAERFMREGYDDYIKLLQYRSNISGDDGGAATPVLGYCMGAYPWAEFNFFHTFQSATGMDISKEWLYVPDFLYYIYWNWLPGDKEFGYGDTRHFTNDLPLGSLHIHLSQMIHFYGDAMPEVAALAKWFQGKVKRQATDAFPFTRFLLTNTHNEISAAEPVANIPTAMHFERMGQLFMRSGNGPDDTYVLFTAGGLINQHRHFDNNNFVIYKKGFRALDTGTRPEPGIHLSHYYCRTIAHNCILIHMPGEVMPGYWGIVALSEEDLPVPNDGGQYKKLEVSEIIAYEENKDYVYIASDATKSYHPDKSKLVLRQFVFLLPDHFVIYDRVISTKPEYKKTWLLHTASEPEIKDNEFFEDYDDGRIFCRTILPEKADIKKIGGPGKQFWSDGRNWPLPVLIPGDWRYRGGSKVLLDTIPLLGQWRIEVSPLKAVMEDQFLHLVQVGDDSVKSMVNSDKIEEPGIAGVRFKFNSKVFEIKFATSGAPGGSISISSNGQKIRDEKFTSVVKPQSTLF